MKALAVRKTVAKTSSKLSCEDFTVGKEFSLDKEKVLPLFATCVPGRPPQAFNVKLKTAEPLDLVVVRA